MGMPAKSCLTRSRKQSRIEQNPKIGNKLKNWHNHIQELTNIRMSVSLSGYAGKDPVNEFRKASFSAFNQLIYEIQKQIVLVLNNMNIQNQSEDIQTKPIESLPVNKKVGRNDPCPCESGKKYKHCCGKN